MVALARLLWPQVSATTTSQVYAIYFWRLQNKRGYPDICLICVNVLASHDVKLLANKLLSDIVLLIQPQNQHFAQDNCARRSFCLNKREKAFCLLIVPIKNLWTSGRNKVWHMDNYKICWPPKARSHCLCLSKGQSGKRSWSVKTKMQHTTFLLSSILKQSLKFH